MNLLTLPEAIDLSIVKWTFLAERDWGYAGDAYYKLAEAHTELSACVDKCGLCQYFRGQKSGGCGNCLLNNGCDCFSWDHPYQNWHFAPTAANARVILDWLVRIKEGLKTKTE